MGPLGGQCRPKRMKWRVVEADLCRPPDAKLGAPVDRNLRTNTVERRGGSGRTRVRLAQTCLLREGGLTCPDPPPDLNNRGRSEGSPEGGELASTCRCNGSRVGRCARRGGFHSHVHSLPLAMFAFVRGDRHHPDDVQRSPTVGRDAMSTAGRAESSSTGNAGGPAAAARRAGGHGEPKEALSKRLGSRVN